MTSAADHVELLYVTADLLFGSRLQGILEARRRVADVVGSGLLACERLASGMPYRLIVVDLETPGLRIDELMAARPAGGPPVIAYGPHVHVQRLEAARQAGCDVVLTRGQFDAARTQWLDHYLPPTNA